MKPPLTPTPVAGPCDRVGVDVIQFPRSRRGNQYVIVFVDYVTKWLEVFPVSDQSAATIANLLVEEVVSRMGFHLRYSQIVGRHSCLDYYERCSSYIGSRKPTRLLTIPKQTGWWKDLTEPSPPY